MKPLCRIPKFKDEGTENPWSNSVYDFDDYDSKIFKFSPTNNSQPLRSALVSKKRVNRTDFQKFFKRQNSEPEIHPLGLDFQSNGSSSEGSGGIPCENLSPSPAITIPRKVAALNNHLYSSSFGALNIESR